MNARTQMVAMIASMETSQIKESVVSISASPLTTENRMVRAELIEEFIRRNGEEAGNELMTRVGL